MRFDKIINLVSFFFFFFTLIADHGGVSVLYTTQYDKKINVFVSRTLFEAVRLTGIFPRLF